MTGETKYLIDTNSLITPQNTYYPFDIAPVFWESMAQKIQDGSIAILDLVKKEILKPETKDDLSTWMSSLKIGRYIHHKQQEIINMYAKVFQSVQNDPCFSEKALHVWADASVADPWLIATAAVYGYTIVTFEKFVNVNKNNPSKAPKIPNIAAKFNVSTTDLFQMMKELGIKRL
jgi:hypothetical protein